MECFAGRLNRMPIRPATPTPERSVSKAVAMKLDQSKFHMLAENTPSDPGASQQDAVVAHRPQAGAWRGRGAGCAEMFF